MTAADWHKRLWDGGLRFDMWHEVIDDLAACEARAEKAEKVQKEYLARTDPALERLTESLEKAEAERDDLRRKLEEAQRDIQAVHDLCFEPKGLMETSMSSTADADHAKAHRILDALLARLGARP